ncbi:DNA repair protein RadA [Hydrogenoanaerobacterium sp.]|uniref:DNA repair protein RadA n=1 Tax=Hydrogenoanaerobacterium sp. TaxID=2953763 RepID=UPI00289ED186|nr:DNA repair protein RadA [Hydrogenoanaerobacterium sp.]
MAGKIKTVFVCNNCGFESPKWYGKCPECGEWNSFAEETRAPVKAAIASKQQLMLSVQYDAAYVSGLNEVDSSEEQRYKTGLNEFDRVLGGGIVRGSLVLLGGDPGIGKSTILLQMCQYLCERLKVLYISGEESRAQVKLRANRLGVTTDNLLLMAHTDIEYVVSAIQANKPDVVIVDSIQTMVASTVSSSCGSVSQVKECTQILARLAKNENVSIFIVGHVNKDGAIAGPKVLEHIVDTVLYFEGERNLFYRILRAVKNRYGSTNEIGVFEMCDTGLREVENPSMMLLSGKPSGVSGTCVVCVMEGSRPILAEIQALVSKSNFGVPRRMSTGFDYNRAALLIAVLEKRGGYFFGNLDAYINVVGGLKLDEPAVDLPVALALVSSLLDKPVSDNVIAFGEIGLAGELRAVTGVEQRIKEAQRMGFERCILPKTCLKGLDKTKYDIEIIGIRSIGEAFSYVTL